MNLSEQRARSVTKELLAFRGWDLNPVSSGGQLLEEGEYRNHKTLANFFPSKSGGTGIGRPDFLLVDSPTNLSPLIVIDAKASVQQIKESIQDTRHYARAIHAQGQSALAVAVAGAEKEAYEVSVQRLKGSRWKDLTLYKKPIDWIPSPEQTRNILAVDGLLEVSAEAPPPKVLADQATRLNELLRECNIKDEFRPVYAASFMLSLWFSDISVDPATVLRQVNTNVEAAMIAAGKPELAKSLTVDVNNSELADRAWEIITQVSEFKIDNIKRSTHVQAAS